MKARRDLIGVTGGIAAYKTAALVSQLVQAGAGVTVVMTEAARSFVGPDTFGALTGRPVATDVFEHGIRWADIKLAERRTCSAWPRPPPISWPRRAGIADDLLEHALPVFTGPVLLAPAMNSEMWEKPAVQRNVQQLRTTGCVRGTRRRLAQLPNRARAHGLPRDHFRGHSADTRRMTKAKCCFPFVNSPPPTA